MNQLDNLRSIIEDLQALARGVPGPSSTDSQVLDWTSRELGPGIAKILDSLVLADKLHAVTSETAGPTDEAILSYIGPDPGDEISEASTEDLVLELTERITYQGATQALNLDDLHRLTRALGSRISDWDRNRLIEILEETR